MLICIDKLRSYTEEMLRAAGMDEKGAAEVAGVFMRATLRGVGHHDVDSLPGRLAQLASGAVNARPVTRLEAKKAAMEAYNGDNGPGELHGMFIMKRAIELAREYGVGVCGVHNSNHILACSPYAEYASEEGMLGYIITRGAPSMGAPGRLEKVSGTAPQAYAAPMGGGAPPLMFDACIAYTSFGVLAEKVAAGEKVPSYWGLGPDGKPTDDPSAIMDGSRLPIGGHKGFGLSILGELLTGVLTGGPVIDAPEPGTGKANSPSHTAICYDIGGLHGQAEFAAHVSEMASRMKARAEGLKLPGERSARVKAEMLAGGVEIPNGIVTKLNAFRAERGLAEITV